MSAVASEITSISIVQVQIKQNIKAPRHWPLQEEFTSDRWIPRKKAASNAENVSIRWRHYVKFVEGTSSWMISSIAFVKKSVIEQFGFTYPIHDHSYGTRPATVHIYVSPIITNIRCMITVNKSLSSSKQWFSMVSFYGKICQILSCCKS